MFDRDEQEISQIIENGLEAILSGTATLESVVAQHPEQAEAIRPELEGALWLVSQRQEVEARPGFVTASRRRVVDRIKAEASSQGAKHSLFGFAWPVRHAYQWAAGAAVILMLLFGAGGVVSISQNALPGDGLYAVKRVSEQVSYTVTLSEVQRVQLGVRYAERRINEVETLMNREEYAAAASALDEYEQQVNLTIAQLKDVSNTQAKAKLGVAVALKDNLVRNTERIDTLLTSAPAVVRADLLAARDISSTGAAVTNDVILLIPLIEGTGTPTQMATPSETFTLEFTGTAVPSETPFLDLNLDGVADTATATATPGKPDKSVTPDGPTETLTPEEILTRTPRPSKTPKPPPATKPDLKDNEGNKDKEKKEPPGKNK